MSTCRGKQKIRTKDVKRVKRMLEVKFGMPVYAYYCEHCLCQHVTTEDPERYFGRVLKQTGGGE